MSDNTVTEGTFYHPAGEYVLPMDNVVLSLTPPAQNRTVTFHNTDNGVVGTLDFNGEEMKFTGKADESAQIFINFLREMWGMENDSEAKASL